MQLAITTVEWLLQWLGHTSLPVWVVVDAAYAKQVFLQAMARLKVTDVSRLRRDAALRTLPPTQGLSGQRGPMPRYGKEAINLVTVAARPTGREKSVPRLYGQPLNQRVKVLQTTWAPADEVILVVIVRERDRWLPFFCTGPTADVATILETMAARGAIKQTFKDLKEVWGTQQQLCHLYACVGAMNLCIWLFNLVEIWAWDKSDDEIIDRSASPWDSEPRRASHADKRKALQRNILRAEIEAVIRNGPDTGEFRALTERLLALAL